MNTFNPVERSIARFLSKFPIVKNLVKISYSRLVFAKNKKKYSYRTKANVVNVSANSGEEVFYGYYDKSPMSNRGLILAHLTECDTANPPSVLGKTSIVVFKEPNSPPIIKIPVLSYNWQQGARAHWLNDDLFVFNDFDSIKNEYISRVFSIKSMDEVRCYEKPVQDSYGVEYFLSINYRRLMAMRPDYGYRNMPMLTLEELKGTDKDGIWRVNYSDGFTKIIISISHVLEINHQPEFEESLHKINHVMISPNGNRFIFLHRYFKGKQRFDRLLVANSDGSEIRVLASYGMVSHCFWVDNDTLVGYLRGPNRKDAYWLIDVKSGEFSSLAGGALDKYGDGHPHVVGNWLITDTYPDKASMQRLLLCNWKLGTVQELGEFYHGFKYKNESRCDLHPRFSLSGDKVFFDSVFEGRRGLYMMELAS